MLVQGLRAQGLGFGFRVWDLGLLGFNYINAVEDLGLGV